MRFPCARLISYNGDITSLFAQPRNLYTTRDVTAADKEARKVATGLDVDDHCRVHSENTAFIQMKDHKENFPGKSRAGS